MAISHNKIKLLDRASLAVSFAGLLLAGLTNQALFALTPLSINAILGLLRREGIERKNDVHRYAIESIDTGKDLLLVGLKIDKLERKIEEERTKTASNIVRVEQLVSAVPKMKSIEQVIDKFVKIRGEAIKSLLETERERRLSPLESKLQKIDLKIADAKAEIDAKLVPISERLSFLPKIDSLEQLIDKSFQKQSELIEILCEELNLEALTLVSDRKESQAQLIKALTEARTRLIIVCPWIRKDVLQENSQGLIIKDLIESALKRQVRIDIGWGNSNDLYNRDSPWDKSISRAKFLSSNNGKKGMYSGLEVLENLAKKYPNLSLEMLGTHEKYLVCDRAYAMIGSHNFLTSGDRSDEKELGLVIRNERTIKQLEERYYDSVKVAKRGRSDCQLIS